MKVTLKNFLIPNKLPEVLFDFDGAGVCAIIPTYKPSRNTATLVESLVRSNPAMLVCVVDDCTPPGYEDSAETFKEIAALSELVAIIRTPVNRLKAGALNCAMRYIEENAVHKETIDVIVTLDDDVAVEQDTIKNLTVGLMSHPTAGAVCSECRVFNKNKNILTRLQGLEYLGFNAIRLSDEGFVGGPLVMHGMLTAFRISALREAGPFAEGHLIEDYEMTTRLKTLGWSVRVVEGARAATMVPERLLHFWRQRTRWAYGGITVVTRARDFSAVLQDLIGHGIFIATILMVDLLIFSSGDSSVPPSIAYTVIIISFLQLILWYGFQLWLLRLYKEKDWKDWLLRLSLVPELLYSYIMTLALVGSYLFFFFALLKRTVTKRSTRTTQYLIGLGSKAFGAVGYTEGWGTRGQ